MNNNYQLFVYGSLREGFGHPAFRYIGDYFHFAGRAKVKGQLYDLGDYPAAVPTAAAHFITGELYAINQPDEFSYAIAQLDDYEGLHVEAGAAEYRREMATIYTESGITDAWVYWYNGSVANKPVIASGDILSYIKGKI